MEEVQPLTKEMDEKAYMPESLIKKFFENGVGILSNCMPVLVLNLSTSIVEKHYI